MITPGRRQLHRSVPRAAAVLILGLIALSVTGPATAGASCGKRVIDDWYADGRVDGTYALHCYDDAIEALPRDVRDYSSAKEDIERALQAAMRGEDPSTNDPGSGWLGGGGPSDPNDPVTGESPGETGESESASPVEPPPRTPCRCPCSCSADCAPSDRSRLARLPRAAGAGAPRAARLDLELEFSRRPADLVRSVCVARTQGAFVSSRYGRDRGRRHAPPSVPER